MLPQIQEILGNLTNSTESSSHNVTSDEMTVLEKLEQENSQNVTERHLLISEKEYENDGSLARYGIQISAGILINASITFGILSAIDSITLSFNPLTFGLICGGLNLISSAITSDRNQSPKVNLMVGASKFVINMSVNGSLIARINEKTNETKTIVSTIKTEIDNYENGYQVPPVDYTMFALMIAGFILAILIIPKIIGKRE